MLECNKGVFMKRFNSNDLSIHKGYLRTKGSKRGYCHRIIWEEDVGPIPEGFDVHHKDGNKLNNLLENLDCISKSDHMRLHSQEFKEKRRQCMSKNSEKVHAWLKTSKGKKFLSNKAKKMWEELPIRTFKCASCKKEFTTKYNKKTVKYCSDNCVMAARRASKVDDCKRTCIICSNLFTINRYQKTVTCGPSCRAKHIGNLKRKH